MIRVKTNKAQQIEKQLEILSGESVRIFKGVENAKMKNYYHAYAATLNGFQTCGTYGMLIGSSNTLIGLVDAVKECKSEKDCDNFVIKKLQQIKQNVHSVEKIKNTQQSTKEER